MTLGPIIMADWIDDRQSIYNYTKRQIFDRHAGLDPASRRVTSLKKPLNSGSSPE